MERLTVKATDVSVVGTRRVRVSFDDGAIVERDLTPLLWGEVFEQIRADGDVFATVAVDPVLGVICWPNEADIDSAVLRYDRLWNEAVGLAHSA